MFFSSLFDDGWPRSFFGRLLSSGATSADAAPLQPDPAPAEAAADDQVAQAPLDPNSAYAKFFDDNYADAARIGAKYGVDPTLSLGVAALESGYGTSKDAHYQNNPLGMRPDSHTPVAFPSTEAVWDEWGRQFGPRVLGVGSDATRFLDRLQEDHRNVYGPTQGADYRGALQ